MASRVKEIEKSIVAAVGGVLLDGAQLAKVLGCRRETASRWARENGVNRLASPQKYYAGDVAKAIVFGRDWDT